MFEDIIARIPRLAIAFVPLLLGIILHEVAHGWVANRCGDKTAKMLGRLTLNPIPHIDPMGLLMFVFTGLFTNFFFGWAKPVPVNPRNFRKPKRDTVLVSAAGSVTNFLLAILFGFLFRIVVGINGGAETDSSIVSYLLQMSQYGVMINLMLCWLNLLPIPPLDGSHIVEVLLPYKAARAYASIGRYGFLILMLLILTGALSYVLWPLVDMSMSFINMLINII